MWVSKVHLVCWLRGRGSDVGRGHSWLPCIWVKQCGMAMGAVKGLGRQIRAGSFTSEKIVVN